MTERTRTNPILSRAPARDGGSGFVEVNGHLVPTEIHAYCAWLNERERRHGTWRVMERETGKTVEFITERGSDDWLRENGLIPKIGRAA